MTNGERHILFVDDDPSMQKIIRHLLESRGVQVTTADDGRMALEIMQAGLVPDVIIADLEMPGMNGLELFRAVRANDAWIAIPFIVLTAHDEKPVMRQALRLGVDDFLTKPVDGERLLLTIYSKAKRAQELTGYTESIHRKLEYTQRDMARMFTHELRTPLVSLNMALELLRRGGDSLSSEEVHEQLETLQSGVTRLNRLVEQMVLLIQLDTGELQKLIQSAGTPGVLWEAVLAATNQARAFSHHRRDIEVVYNDGGVTGEIRAEWRTLRHALAELLSNAMAFSPPGEPVLVTQWRDSRSIAISIVDHGPGIPPEMQGDLFRRFKQLEREKHEQQGIGIGLYLARNIIEATGGELILISDTGQGTSVIVRFPLLS